MTDEPNINIFRGKVLFEDLTQFERLLFEKYAVPWFAPECPTCCGMLSQKLFSERLVCMRCSAEYKLELIIPEKIRQFIERWDRDHGKAKF